MLTHCLHTVALKPEIVQGAYYTQWMRESLMSDILNEHSPLKTKINASLINEQVRKSINARNVFIMTYDMTQHDKRGRHAHSSDKVILLHKTK